MPDPSKESVFTQSTHHANVSKQTGKIDMVHMPPSKESLEAAKAFYRVSPEIINNPLVNKLALALDARYQEGVRAGMLKAKGIAEAEAKELQHRATVNEFGHLQNDKADTAKDIADVIDAAMKEGT